MAANVAMLLIDVPSPPGQARERETQERLRGG